MSVYDRQTSRPQRSGQSCHKSSYIPQPRYAPSKGLDTLIQVTFIVVTQNNIDTLDSSNIVRAKLSIAARNSDYGIRIATMNLAYYVATLLIGVFGYRAAIDNCHIGLGIRLDTKITTTFKLARYGR